MISFIHSLFALLFRGAFLLLMLLIFLLICFNFLSFKIFLPAFLPCLFLKNLACSLVGVSLVGVVTCMPWSLCLGACALELVPWSLCLGGSCLVVVTCIPWSLCLGACALVVRAWWWLPACLGACALELVPWWLAVTCVP